MSFLAFAAAATMSMPELTRKDWAYMWRAYPDWVWDVEESTAVEVTMTVNRQGEVVDCEVMQFVGNERLASMLCRVWVGRRIREARTVEHKRTYAHWHNIIVWSDGTPEDNRSDELRAGRTRFLSVPLPKDDFGQLGEEDRLEDVLIEVDRNGSVIACHEAKDWPSEVERLACDRVRQQTFAPLLDEKGEAVSYITNLEIHFELEQP